MHISVLQYNNIVLAKDILDLVDDRLQDELAAAAARHESPSSIDLFSS
jgi:hypothetical protein